MSLDLPLSTASASKEVLGVHQLHTFSVHLLDSWASAVFVPQGSSASIVSLVTIRAVLPF
jgi:hypothetical protein